MFLKVLLVAFQLATYNVGDTSTAKFLRVGISLGVKGPVKVICVDTGATYNVFVPYENVEVTSIINPVGHRLFIAVSNGQPLMTNDWTEEEWKIPDPHLASTITSLYFYKVNPTKSRWYYLVNDYQRGIFYIQRGRQYSSRIDETNYFVATPEGDTAVGLNDLAFDPVAHDSILYIAADIGVYKGVATTSGPFYESWEWSKIGDFKSYAVYVLDNGTMLVGTDDGVSYYDGNAWHSSTLSGVKVNKIVFNSDDNNLYATTERRFYYSADGVNWNGPVFEEQNITAITFDGDNIIVGTADDGIYKGD